MANSLRAKLSKLRYKGHIDNEEYQELINKLDGHDRELRAKAIDEFAHKLKKTFALEFLSNYESTRPYFTLGNARMIVDDIAEQLKGGAE